MRQIVVCHRCGQTCYMVSSDPPPDFIECPGCDSIDVEICSSVDVECSTERIVACDCGRTRVYLSAEDNARSIRCPVCGTTHRLLTAEDVEIGETIRLAQEEAERSRWRAGWKVVRVYREPSMLTLWLLGPTTSPPARLDYFSAIASVDNLLVPVEYKPGLRVRGDHLCVFDARRDAERFVGKNDFVSSAYWTLGVVPCLYQPVDTIPEWARGSGVGMRPLVPDGTVFASAVILLPEEA